MGRFSGSLSSQVVSITAVQGGVAIGQLQLPHQQAMTGQPVRLAPRPVFLVGREELLRELDTRLTGR